jgi:Fur family transcriptional regulator, ferric uptake regulator
MIVMSESPSIDFQAVGLRLRERGMRLSRLKRAVLTELARARVPLAAEELAIRVDGENDPSPVYRCLASLEEAGVVCHLYMGDASRRWNLSEDFGGHHDFLVCAACLAVEPLSDCALSDAVADRVTGRGFVLLDHQVVLTGLCAECQEADQSP